MRDRVADSGSGFPATFSWRSPGTRSWLLKLRLFVAGFCWLTTLAVVLIFDLDSRLEGLAALFLLSLLMNLRFFRATRLKAGVRGWQLSGILISDVLALTGMLYLTGGATNPLTIFYVIPVMVSALLLGTPWSWGMAVICAVCYGILFPFHLPIEHGPTQHAAAGFDFHLYWMYSAFLGVIGCVALLMGKLVRIMAIEREQVFEDRARSDRFEALVALAGGAAHELATPLSTIAVVSKEMERIGADTDIAQIRADAGLIRGEVGRCRTILDRLHPSTMGGNNEELDLFPLVREVLRDFDDPRILFSIPSSSDLWVVEAPPTLLRMAIHAIVSNAVDASPLSGTVRIEIDFSPKGVTLSISDDGPGIPAEILAHAGEPFVTTKPPGKGMGLGLFIARRVADQSGAIIAFEARTSGGTTVRMHFPPLPDMVEGGVA